jgi:Flp pilus assembly protein TadG
MDRLTKKVTQETGSVLLEFTFVFMIMLSLTFAMIDFGRYVYANNIVRSASQEGARVGISLGKTESDIVTTAKSKLITLDPDKATVTAPLGVDGNVVQVDITYEFEFITPFISASAGGPIQITGSASMLKFPS